MLHDCVVLVPEEHQCQVQSDGDGKQHTENDVVDRNKAGGRTAEEGDLRRDPEQARNAEPRLRRDEEPPDDGNRERRDDRGHDVHLDTDVRVGGEQAELERKPDRKVRAPQFGEYSVRSGKPTRRRMRLSASRSCAWSPMSYHSPGNRYA